MLYNYLLLMLLNAMPGCKLVYYWTCISYCLFSCLSQELNSKAEGKFNRLKAQAKTKIAALNKELERLREGQGEPQLNLSAQVSRLLLFLSRGTMACVCVH